MHIQKYIQIFFANVNLLKRASDYVLSEYAKLDSYYMKYDY